MGWGDRYETRRLIVDDGEVWLGHACCTYRVGGEAEIRQLIADLGQALAVVHDPAAPRCAGAWGSALDPFGQQPCEAVVLPGHTLCGHHA